MSHGTFDRMLDRMIAEAAKGDMERAEEAQWRSMLHAGEAGLSGPEGAAFIARTLDAVRCAPAGSNTSSLLVPLDGLLPDVSPAFRGDIAAGLWATLASPVDGASCLWLVGALVQVAGIDGLVGLCEHGVDRLCPAAREVIRGELQSAVAPEPLWRRVRAVLERL